MIAWAVPWPDISLLEAAVASPTLLTQEVWVGPYFVFNKLLRVNLLRGQG